MTNHQESSEASRGDSALSELERASIEEWLRKAQNGLMLGHWRIDLSRHAPPSDSWAMVVATESQYHATIMVDGTLLLESKSEILRCLTHELVHLHHGHLMQELRTSLDNIDSAHSEAIESIVRHNFELLVDQVARVLVDAGAVPSAKGLAKLR